MLAFEEYVNHFKILYKNTEKYNYEKITIIVCLLFIGLVANAQEKYYNANIKTQLKGINVMVGS